MPFGRIVGLLGLVTLFTFFFYISIFFYLSFFLSLPLRFLGAGELFPVARVGKVFPVARTGEVFPVARMGEALGRQSSPFPFPLPIPPLEKHVYLDIGVSVVNSLLNSAQKKGLMKNTFFATDFPMIKILLGTT